MDNYDSIVNTFKSAIKDEKLDFSEYDFGKLVSFAIDKGFKSFLEFAIKVGATVTTEKLSTIEDMSICDFFMDKNAYSVEYSSLEESFFDSVAYKNTRLMRRLIDCGVDVTRPLSRWDTYLDCACEAGFTEGVNIILESAKTKFSEEDLKYALSSVSQRGYLEIVNAIINFGVSELCLAHGLNSAIASGNLICVKLFTDKFGVISFPPDGKNMLGTESFIETALKGNKTNILEHLILLGYPLLKFSEGDLRRFFYNEQDYKRQIRELEKSKFWSKDTICA